VPDQVIAVLPMTFRDHGPMTVVAPVFSGYGGVSRDLPG